jgi:dihydrolipoamide dehydrogenase
MDTFDVIVIGSGPGGYVAAIRCAQLGLKTACIEKTALGGTCLNVGCIPSKALLHSTEVLYNLTHHGKALGVEVDSPRANFSQMMGRKEQVVNSFNQGIEGLFKKNKITSFKGTGHFTSPTTVRVGETELSAKFIIIATGSEPMPLPFLPFDEKKILSSTGALALQTVPRKMLVVGAGVIGVELGSVYSRLGSEVVFVEFMDRICPTLDETLSKTLQKSLTAQGMTFHLSSKVTAGKTSANGVSLTVALPDEQTHEMQADVALISIGRRPYTAHLDLEKAGIQLTPKGMIPINGRFQTSVPHIFAIGDVVDGPMLAHKASEEGVAVAEIIAGHAPHIEYLAIPNVVYTSPEVASCGFSEQEANNLGLSIKTGSFPFKANSRARCTGEEEGLVKIIVEANSDRIIGVHIIGAHASELISAGVLAIEKKTTGTELANSPQAHPTLAEALKEAALDLYKRALHK